jgi:hypothetical protein
MDGIDSFPDKDIAEGPNGNEPPRSGVQPETGAVHLRNATSGCVHEGVARSAPLRDLKFMCRTTPARRETAAARSVSTQPRPKPARGDFPGDLRVYFASGRLPESSSKSEFVERGHWQISTGEFAESCLWKCEALDPNGSLRASSRTHTIGP